MGNTAANAVPVDQETGFLLDENGNEVVRQHIRNDSFRASLADEAGTPRWVTVMVEARTAGDKLTITSLRR